MRKFIVSGFAIILIVSAASSSNPAMAQKSAQPSAAASKNRAAAAISNAVPAHNRTTTNRQSRDSDPSIAAWGRTSYNYTGIGFPRMEGGLTAAANRTTWLKPMYPPHRRGRW